VSVPSSTDARRRGDPYFPGRLIPLVCTVAAGTLVGQTARWRRDECPNGGGCLSWIEQLLVLTTTLLLAAGLMVLVTLLARFILRRVGRVARVRPTARAVALMLAIAAFLSTPVYVDWEDGCNSQGGWGPAPTVARVALSSPENAGLMYVSWSTLVLCSDRNPSR
jgi:hypothetical protein